MLFVTYSRGNFLVEHTSSLFPCFFHKKSYRTTLHSSNQGFFCVFFSLVLSDTLVHVRIFLESVPSILRGCWYSIWWWLNLGLVQVIGNVTMICCYFFYFDGAVLHGSSSLIVMIKIDDWMTIMLSTQIMR